MPKKKTHEQYIKEVAAKQPDIKVLGQYVNARTSMPFICKKCNHTWSVRAGAMQEGWGCSKCGHKRGGSKITKTHKQFVAELKIRHPHLQAISRYKTSYTKMTFRCKIHKWEFDNTPNALTLKSRIGCSKCSDNYRPTTEEFKHRLALADPTKELLDEYVSNNVKVRFRCLLDGHVWKAPPGQVLRGKGCPLCNGNISKISLKWLTHIAEKADLDISHAANSTEEYSIPGTPYRADGFCERYSIIFEYYGNYWHGHPNYCNAHFQSELLEKTIIRHERIKDLGYNIIYVWSHEYKKGVIGTLVYQRRTKGLVRIAKELGIKMIAAENETLLENCYA